METNTNTSIAAMIKDVGICMFTTVDEAGKVTSRPMATIHVDENNNIWFFTNEFSEKIHDVSRDNVVNLIYSHPGKNTYLDIHGTCKIIVDKSVMKTHWNPMMKAWFPAGLDDPKLCMLQVITQDAYYWNSSANRMVVFAGMFKAIVKGEKYAEGEAGKVKL
ncbi:pyridoxamine 5'-phosphate oxidase family protein [Flavihumibacter petaseus]|uniref:General stress protein FMN-binding split barrel domain-containing protein n=1 Tax=Flavihumibacter petaseus NBRC 106054 TaxID=1220578 RepID=A0A0E9MZA2_9BACT|nr:pyridoxamine 5'-phosphate oxidase family protein [Flavihumibacter petaseus]GAO42425.1 hypothetical protein FPE01S_01_14400 [Flavihumibacter petaseus NBRC 106054]